MNLEEKLEIFFSKDVKNQNLYNEKKKDFIDIKLDLFVNKVYPKLYEGIENGTFLGMHYKNKIFTFFYLNEDNTDIVSKSLTGGNTEEDYKRYQEQLMELGRS